MFATERYFLLFVLLVIEGRQLCWRKIIKCGYCPPYIWDQSTFLQVYQDCWYRFILSWSSRL